jgi:phosphopantothenoylcysteine synthetase/decarboxylase
MTIRVLNDKRILLGVTGGVAAYKAAFLASRLTQAGAIVDVVMTEAATRLVAPLTHLIGQIRRPAIDRPSHGQHHGQVSPRVGR